MTIKIDLTSEKKVYFASDFHLGTPDKTSSLEREKKIVRWLEAASKDADSIFLLGDIFDFWFEYKKTIPKGFVRFQGKLAELADSGIKIHLFTGNHDMWMYDYFPSEFGIPVHRDPIELEINNFIFLIGHGDGLGPGDKKYKRLKKIFKNKFSQKTFAMLHPNIGVGLAHRWSRKSRLANGTHDEVSFGDKEHLLIYCKEQENIKHHDYYLFGHRHLRLNLAVSDKSRYINAGDWVNHSNYVVFDGDSCRLEEFES